MNDSAPEGGRSPPVESRKRAHAFVAAKMLTVVVAMFGFGYLLVPIYDIICDVTGLNGKTGRVSETQAQAQSGAVDENREITVEFTAMINAGGSWVFQPESKTMVVTPGKTYLTNFYAENLSAEHRVAQATPSVTPFTAAKYFNKTECFCFTRQEFDAGSGRDMPVAFVIDPDIPPNVDRMTLSYTFFSVTDQPG